MKGVAAFTGLVDLVAGNLGGLALGASDDFFAECQGLVNPKPAVFIPDKFTERGKWMDGWESRRRRGPGYDFCVLKLGARGRVRGLDIDTSFFNGNQPAFASVDAVLASPDASYQELLDADWSCILEAARVHPDCHNLFACLATQTSVSHLRLNIFPDGGVARLRAYGVVDPELGKPVYDAEQQVRVPAGCIDFAALERGGAVMACSDAHFGSEQQLLLPGRSPNMGGGWETRRRRGPGHDWVVVRLAGAARLELLEVDTQHFKGNYPDSCSIEGIYAPGAAITSLVNHPDWLPLLENTKLAADTRHFFPLAADANRQQHGRGLTHLRLNTFPDGGISRLRAWGRP
jgi:allantoicase